MSNKKPDYKALLEGNADDCGMLQKLVREVNSWNGALESYGVYDFDDDFFDTYFSGNPQEAAQATYFGNIRNWLDEYIRFNGYGNLESLTAYSYDKELAEGADEIIAEALHNIDNIDIDWIIDQLDLEASDG